MVPGRECGACSICCEYLPIDTDEIQKLPGRACRHSCRGDGCAIYDARPKVCRTYHCAWRYLTELDETWRPDLSGVLIEFHDEGIPSRYSKRPGLRLGILKDPKTVLKRGFLKYVAKLVSEDVPVFLSVLGPPGYYPAITFLNDATGSAVRRGDERALARALADIIRSLAGYEFRPAIILNTGNRVDDSSEISA